MKLFDSKTSKWLGLSLCALLLSSTALSADYQAAHKPLNDYFKECPWLGLIANKITVGPITISDVSIHDGDKLAYASPGETLNGMLKYKVKAKDLDSLHLYHLVIGVKDQGAQDCVTHNLGVWDTKGHGRFTLKAPDAPGIYEVRFLLTQGLTCSAARDTWNSGVEEPTSSATIGIIIVE